MRIRVYCNDCNKYHYFSDLDDQIVETAKEKIQVNLHCPKKVIGDALVVLELQG